MTDELSIINLLGENIIEITETEKEKEINIDTTPKSPINSPTTPGYSPNKPDDNKELRHFFLSYLEQTPKTQNRRRNQQVTSLGESLTAEEAMSKQKAAEDKKKKDLEDKEKRKKERLEKQEQKKNEMEEKRKKKEEKKRMADEKKRKTEVHVKREQIRKSKRPRKVRDVDNFDMCDICMEVWEEETEQEELWIMCESCCAWYHAKCVGYEPTSEEIDTQYTCQSCS